MRKTVLIKATDIIPYRSGIIAGVGRSTIELINQLISINDPQFRIKIYCTGFKSILFKHYGWNLKYYFLPFSIRGYSKLSQILEPIVRKYFIQYDLFHITNNKDTIYCNENLVVTIHDMILYETCPLSRNLFESMGSNSKAIITCSDYSKKKIIEYLKVPDKKITVIPWGINHSIFKKKSDITILETCTKFGINSPYFFSCSCGDRRKNPDITIEAFRRLVQNQNNVTLVLVWGNCPDDIKKQYSKEINDGKIKIIKGVSNEELANLYSGALASYFISSAEGFGFPMLESFACGTPCVTCRNTSLEEIGKDYAYYVKERDVDSTLSSMLHFISHEKGDVERLMEYAKKFSWNSCALSYIELYKKILL